MQKTCDTCCFAHKCGGDEPCEFYCCTASICDTDDEEYIEEQRCAFRAEWFAYTESFYK